MAIICSGLNRFPLAISGSFRSRSILSINPVQKEPVRSLPSRCGFCLAGGLRVLGSGGLRLCDPLTRQSCSPAQDRAPAQAPGGASTPRGPAFLRQLPLSSPELELLTPGRRQGRVAPRRTLSTGGLSGDQPVPSARAGGGVLQSARHGGAVDPRG